MRQLLNLIFGTNPQRDIRHKGTQLTDAVLQALANPEDKPVSVQDITGFVSKKLSHIQEAEVASHLCGLAFMDFVSTKGEMQYVITPRGRLKLAQLNKERAILNK